MHKHETGNNINYIVSGMGKAICDDDEESLFAGICHRNRGFCHDYDRC